ncbi:MAG: HD-GYP domain-containing protein [Thiohalomonadaceae bacterium]
MNREHILSVLYDLTMIIGGEVSLKPLLTRTLQRLLYHTSFPTGLAFLDLPDPQGDNITVRVDAAVGDFELAGLVGQPLTLPTKLVCGGPELLEGAELFHDLPCSRNAYAVGVRLPIDHCGVILLLAPRQPHTELPLTSVFQPVLANLAKAILLCRRNDAYTAGLLAERDVAKEELADSVARLQRALLGTIQAIATTVEKRDPYTAGHQQRTSRLASAIARRLGWDEGRIEGLRLGAMIHDIGKIYVPAEILSRPGKLTESEFRIIKAHAQVGYDIVKDIEFPWPVAEMILHHHERLDGSGYPQGLVGDAICPEARVLAVADVIEAMSSHRPYRPAIGVEAGLREIVAQKGRFFEPDAVDACVAVMTTDGFRFDA